MLHQMEALARDKKTRTYESESYTK